MSEKSTLSEVIGPTEKGEKSLLQIIERFRVADVPAALRLFAGSESGISDLFANLSRQLADGKLTEKTKLLVAVAVAAAVGGRDGAGFFADAALAAGRSKPEILDAIAAATTCSIYNGYYRFRHQVPAERKATFEAFRAPFSANSLLKATLPQVEIEAICIAVSSANHCNACVESHISKGINHGLTNEQIDEIIKVGAVAAATAQLIATLAYDSIQSAPPTISA